MEAVNGRGGSSLSTGAPKALDTPGPLADANAMSPITTARHDEIVRRAASQAGVVGRTQLIGAGWTDSAIRANLASRRWARLLPGVYNTVTGEPSDQAWWWAAHLYGGNDSRICCSSAMQAWGLDRFGLPVHLAIPANRQLPHAGAELAVHRQEHERSVRHPAGCPPTVSLAHTVLDLASGLDEEQSVLALVARVCQRRPQVVEHLGLAVHDRKRIRHRKLITSLLSEIRDGATTPLEIPGVRLILRAHGLPTGRGQVREEQHGSIVVRDRVIEAYGVVLEFDGRLGHADPIGRFRDLQRDNAVTASGRVSLRFGWTDVHHESCEAAQQVARVLAARGWTGIPRACGPGCRAFRVS